MPRRSYWTGEWQQDGLRKVAAEVVRKHGRGANKKAVEDEFYGVTDHTSQKYILHLIDIITLF